MDRGETIGSRMEHRFLASIQDFFLFSQSLTQLVCSQLSHTPHHTQQNTCVVCCLYSSTCDCIISHVQDKCDWELSQNLKSDWKLSQNKKKDYYGCELSQVRDIVKLFATLLSTGILEFYCKSQHYPTRRFARRKKNAGSCRSTPKTE